MKIQCQCGTKYAFDVTPDMLANPVRLVCQNCGADNSAAVNMIIQQQFSTRTETAPPVPAPAPMPVESVPLMKVKVHAAAPAEEEQVPAPTPAPSQMCRKHPGHFTSEQCRVCNKPICPQCMTLFGYVCSAFCRNEAEQRGLDLPVYENQAGVASTRHTRKLGRIVFGILGGVGLFLSVYIWYLSSASRPHVVFAAQFKTPASKGGAKLFERDVVLLHGGRLARYDWKSKKEIWSLDLIDMNRISTQADQELVEQAAEIEEWRKNRTGLETSAPERYTKEQFERQLLSSAQMQFTLHVHEQNIWLRSPDKLVQYDWATGKPGKEVALKGYVRRTVPSADALLMFSSTDTGEELAKLDWKSGDIQIQQLQERPSPAALLSKTGKAAGSQGGLSALMATNRTTAAANSARSNALVAEGGTPANPALKGYKVAQPDPMQVRIAAPAIAAAAVQNKRIEKELEEDDERVPAFLFDAPGPKFINDRGTLVEFSVKLLEAKTIERVAMKAAPKKSALEGTVNQAATVAIANEIFNEFAREATGGVEREDASRYEVTIQRAGKDSAAVKLEVIGSPDFFPLDTVDLVTAGKTLLVLDKSGKKLWESKLNYGIGGGFGISGWGGELVATAAAPGVERGNRLYFFDEGVLTCFDLATGNALWRQPSVGVTKLMFDDKGMLYVDTTTGSADSLRYSQQIDISDKAYPVIIKIDPKNGKALWRSQQNGRLSHVFGKLVYTMEWHGGDEDEAPSGPLPGLQTPPHIRIRRLSASDGKVVWEHYQKRAPLNVDIQQNTIQLVFKKEIQVLKFMAF
jgi:hypothetical protein